MKKIPMIDVFDADVTLKINVKWIKDDKIEKLISQDGTFIGSIEYNEEAFGPKWKAYHVVHGKKSFRNKKDAK